MQMKPQTALVLSIVSSNEFKKGAGTSNGEIKTASILQNLNYSDVRFYSITDAGITFKHLTSTIHDILEYAQVNALNRPLLVVDHIQGIKNKLHPYLMHLLNQTFLLKESNEIFCEGAREIE